MKTKRRVKTRKKGGGKSKNKQSSRVTKTKTKTKSIDIMKARSAPIKLSTRKSKMDNKGLINCEKKHKRDIELWHKDLDKCEGENKQWLVDFDYTNKYYLSLLNRASKLLKRFSTSTYVQDYYEDDVKDINEFLQKIPSR
jgi:hypothetical protein